MASGENTQAGHYNPGERRACPSAAMKYTRCQQNHFSAVPRSALHRLPALVLGAVLALGAAAPAAADPAPERELEALKARIAELEAGIRRDTDRRSREAAALREAEQRVAHAARALETTRRDRADSQKRLAGLRAREAELEQALARDADALAAEIRSAWMAGRESRLKLVMSQADPARLGRMLAFYGYLARDRAGRIDATRTRLAELAEVQAGVRTENLRLAEMERRREQDLAGLQAARAERAQAVAALEASLQQSGRQVETLQEEAQALEALIKELRAAVADLPVPDAAPFAAQKGRLEWPARGRLARDFGDRRGEGPRSTGVLIDVPRGTEVTAVWSGRVAYADWLPGLGLLLIVEHDDGYLSLYGHNEVLFKTVGDWVRAGEVIASSGDTGGRERAGLYFEIRKGRKAENPRPWFAKRPGPAR